METRVRSLFGRLRAEPKLSAPESIAKLRDTIDMLEKRERHLEVQAGKQTAAARACVAAKNKRGALLALKRRKVYESQGGALSNTLVTLETQIMALENIHVNKVTVEAMKGGAAAMKDIHSGMTVEDVADTTADIEDQMAVAAEMGAALAQPMGGFLDDIDEDALNNELDQLEAEDVDAAFLFTAAPARAEPAVASPLPTQVDHSHISIPAGAPPVEQFATNETPEERELRELSESMAV